MNFVINPGSEHTGGTKEEADKIAALRLKNIQEEYPEVTMSYIGNIDLNDYQYEFTHGVTGVSVVLNTHGYSEEERKKFIFGPRIYWNGSSCSNPKIEDWLPKGGERKYRITYYK